MSALQLAAIVSRRFLGSVGLSLLGCVALFSSSCATDDVTVATLPNDAVTSGDTDCETNDDCPPAAYCARTSCNDARGACEIRPIVCDDQGQPACGCDGVSYWNDCLRKQYGATASAQGSCARAAACADANGLDCPILGAACAKLLPPGSACDDNTLGACWILPVACSEFGPPDRWMACDGQMECLDTCSAIRTGRPYRHDVMRQCPSPEFPAH